MTKSRFWTSGHPCFYKIAVFAQAAKVPVWSVSSGTRCVALSRAIYGAAPPGFAVDVPAGVLTDGEHYTVVAHGDGWSGTAKFRRKAGLFVDDGK